MPFRITIEIPDSALAESFSTQGSVTVERTDTPESAHSAPPTPAVSDSGFVVSAETGQAFPGSPPTGADDVAPTAAPEAPGAEVAPEIPPPDALAETPVDVPPTDDQPF